MTEKTDPQQDVPNELARKLSQWHQANPKATLTEIEEAVEAELAMVRRQLVEELAQEKIGEQKVPDCPQCGQQMVKNGQRKRKLKSKEGQTIQLNRQQWRCLNCGATFFPPG
ncbi:MAG: transposase family protein [Ardenticatenaceae bacterium]|nr:transposase family protein [Ardenticatenaceae bacterium]MCB8980867.1 transposase family protein [Ardenticatenaceae bacterium]